ncbi:hypothetical protein G9464_02840 [Halostella sp. JP-L12]|uniref:hypothetical protein n=1 Tax=Halostella TaxID=1843185 RepID=UPI000EF7C769|nr:MULTISPECIES: hypothetical protein [Halostella]NHN46534.1 hypothetical protein [Halostella sp. JP-L12]
MGLDTQTVRSTVDHWRQSQRLRLVAISTTMYLVGTLLINRAALTVGIPLDASTGFVLALGVVFGPTVAIGAGLGYVFTDLLTGTFGLHSAFGYAAAFLLVFVAVAYWNTLDNHIPLERGRWDFVQFVVAATPAVLTASTVEAWGADLLVRAPFATVFLNSLGGTVGGVAVGLAALPIVRYLSGIGSLVRTASPSSEPVFPKRWAITVAVVPALWGVFGTLLSVAFQPLQLEYPQILANRFGWTALTIVDLVGPAGRNAQFLLGLLGFTLLTLAVGSVRRS